MPSKEDLLKATTLVEALPYIRRFAGKTVVIDYGDAVLSDDQALASLANDVVLLKYVGIDPVIVHGGGDAIAHWLELFSRSKKGRDASQDDSIAVTEMVISGNINTKVVSSLAHAGGRAVGISGRDGNSFTACTALNDHGKKTAAIESTDPTLINTLVQNGYIPVVSTLGVTRENELLALSSDHVAASIAAALKAAKLIYLRAKRGIESDGKLLSSLDLRQAQELSKAATVTNDDRELLHGAIAAIKRGISNVHIVDSSIAHSVLLEVFTDSGVGTMISNERAVI